MTARAIAALAIRLMGIYILVEMLMNLPFLFNPLFVTVNRQTWAALLPGLLISLALALFFAGVGIAVLLLANKLAGRLVPDAEANVKMGLDAEQAARLGFCLVGLFAIVWALPNIANVGTVLALAPEQRPTPPIQYGRLAAGSAQLIVGLILVLGSNGLHRIWARLRHTKPAAEID